VSPAYIPLEKYSFLESCSDLSLLVLMFLVIIIYTLFFCCPIIRAYAGQQKSSLQVRGSLASNAFTLLGVVSGTLAIAASLIPNHGIAKYNAFLVFMAGTAVFLFCHIFFLYFDAWWTTYFSDATQESSLYCLGLSLFALFDALQLEWIWRLLLLIVPLVLLSHSVIHLVLAFKFQLRSAWTEEETMSVWIFRGCKVHGAYPCEVGDTNCRCPQCGSTSD